MASVDLDMQGYGRERGLHWLEQLADQVEALPVASAAIGARVPFDNFMSVRTVSLSGSPGVKDGDALQIGLNQVDPSYFETLGVTLLSGRGISGQDDQSSPRVAVVNETFAQRLWPDEDPIGKSFRLLRVGSSRAW